MPRSITWAALSVSLFLTTGLITGCATRGPVPVSSPPAAEPSADLWELYVQAVEATMHPKPAAISTALVPIVRSTPGLRWDGQGRVLMVTWSKSEYYKDSVGKPYTFSHGDVWLTAVPFAQQFCRSQNLPPGKLQLRLNQLLGLPPDEDNDAFVQMWVDPRTFFRPCADPEITDRECTLNLTVDGSPESVCPWKDSFENQVSRRWVAVTWDRLEWMCNNWTKSYPADPRKGYPWTGLGYTYDWGKPDPVGQSEFVAPQGTTVVIESVTGTADYCRPR